jgi:hypothetical protein
MGNIILYKLTPEALMACISLSCESLPKPRRMAVRIAIGIVKLKR